MDKQEETTEEVEEVVVVEYYQIKYDNKHLSEWEEELTIEMPAMPCTSDEIDRTCAELNNKYQIAYNMYNRLFISYKELQSRVRHLLIQKVSELDAQYSQAKGRVPGKERLEDIARNKFATIQLHEDKLVKISILKDFFENNKNKLKDAMLLTNSLSYSANQSDRMFDKSSRSNGM